MGGVQGVERPMAVRCFDCEGRMVCRRGLRVMVKRFVGLFISYKRGGEIKGCVVAEFFVVGFKHCIVGEVHMTLPHFHSSQSI